jgi:hypothetical protein
MSDKSDPLIVYEKFLEQAGKFADLCNKQAVAEQERIRYEQDRLNVDRQILERLDDISAKQESFDKRVTNLENRLYGSVDRDTGLVSQIKQVETDVSRFSEHQKTVVDLQKEIDASKFQIKLMWGALTLVASTVIVKLINLVFNAMPDVGHKMGTLVYHFASMLYT